jgi:hypothetical protein
MARRKSESGDTVKVRVLADCWLGKPDQVIELPADVAAQACEFGFVDADPSAVAYAESLAS